MVPLIKTGLIMSKPYEDENSIIEIKCFNKIIPIDSIVNLYDAPLFDLMTYKPHLMMSSSMQILSQLFTGTNSFSAILHFKEKRLPLRYPKVGYIVVSRYKQLHFLQNTT